MATIEDRLDPTLVAELRRRLTQQAGLDVPVQAEPPPPDATADAPLPTPVEPPSVPSPAPVDFRTKLYDQLQSRLGPAFGQNAMEEAQRRDDRLNFIRSLGEIGQGTSWALAGMPRQPAEVRNDATQRLQAQRQDALGALGVSGQLAQFDAQQRLMDPNSPESKQARAMALSQAPEVVRAIGPGFFQATAAQIQQAVASMKGMGEAREPGSKVGLNIATTEKTLKEIPGIQADAQAKVALQQPMSAEHIASLARAGIQIPPGTTYAQAKDLADQQVKGAGVQIDWAKLALEKFKAGAEGPSVKLRQEFQGQQTYKDMQQVAAAYAKIKNSSPTGPGDIALLTAYMKLLDPTSVVREGEFATAENAGSAFQKVGGLYNKVLTGGKLTPELRAQFRADAKNVYGAAKGRYDSLAKEYRRLARQNGVPEADVVMDIGAETPGSASPGAAGGSPPPPPPSWRPD
jgi:hypothetical protein